METIRKKVKLDENDRQQEVVVESRSKDQTSDQEEEESGDEDSVHRRPKHFKDVVQRRDCPYLSTIKRHMLDFDFEKVCSVSCLNINIYACLTCGKYFQGRSKNTHAYTHCLEESHHVFINLKTTKVP